MADVILIRPISDSWPGEAYVRNLSIPHGPLVLAAHLVDKGFTVKIIDEIALTEVIEDKVSDIALDQVRNLLKEPTVCIGITSMTGEQIRRGKIYASLVKKINPKIPIVWGGAHPTLLPEMTLADKDVDIIVAGEGDISFPKLVSELKKNGTGNISKVPGIHYVDKNGKEHKTKPARLFNMNLMPEIPYHLIDMELYITKIKKKDMTRFFEINSARGCPFKCSFCLSSKEDYTYTKMDSDRLIKEIIHLKKNYNIDGLSFNDENFIMNKKRLITIAEELVKLNLNLKVRSGGSIQLFLKFDDDLLKLMKKAGFYHFGFGVETGSDVTLSRLNKQITQEKIRQIIAKMREHKFQATYNFIGGFPNETVNDYKKTLQLIYHIFENSAHMVYPVPAPNFYHPLPGTQDYDRALKLGYQPPESFSEWSGIDGNADSMPWLAKDCRELVVKSRDIINNINKKFTGDNAVISKADLIPLNEIMY